MADDTIIRNVTVWETDDRSVADSIQKSKSLIKSQEAVVKSTSDQTTALKQMTQAENDAAAAAKKRVDTQSQKPSVGGGSKGAAAGSFDVVSKDVAIYGDVESQVRTLSGALGYMGGEAGSAAEGVINVGAELFAVVEAGPKLVASLGEAAVKFGDTVPLVGSLATGLTTLVPALGATGAAVIAVAAPLAVVAVAIAGVTLALKALSDAGDAAAQAITDQVDSSKKRIAIEREIADFQAEGDKAGAQARIDELKRQQEDSDKLLTELYVARDEINKAYDELGAALNPQKRIELGAAGQEAEKQIDAEFKLFDERAKAIAQLESALPTIADNTTEEQSLADARAETAAVSSDAKQAEQDVQKARQEAEQKAKELAQATQQLADATASAQRKYNEAVTAAGNTLSDANKDIATDLKRTVADLDQTFNNDLNKLATDFRRNQFEMTLDYNQNEQKVQRQHYESLKKIQKDAARQQRDALRNRDFLSLDLLAENTKNQIDDQQDAAEFEQKEREIAFKEAQDDRLRAAYQERQDRLDQQRIALTDARKAALQEQQDARTAYTRQLRDANLARESELANAQAAYQSKLQLEQAYYQASIGLVRNAIGAIGGQASAGGVTNNITVQGITGGNLQERVLRAMNSTGVFG